MDKIKIDGVHPSYDGEWDFDLSYFTNRELHTIKTIAGVRPTEIESALEAGDNDLMVAFTIIALRRKGKTIHEDTLWDAPVGKITFLLDAAEEDEASPPVETPPEPARDESEKHGSSGKSSSATSDQAANGHTPIGVPGSGTDSVSRQAISTR